MIKKGIVVCLIISSCVSKVEKSSVDLIKDSDEILNALSKTELAFKSDLKLKYAQAYLRQDGVAKIKRQGDLDFKKIDDETFLFGVCNCETADNKFNVSISLHDLGYGADYKIFNNKYVEEVTYNDIGSGSSVFKEGYFDNSIYYGDDINSYFGVLSLFNYSISERGKTGRRVLVVYKCQDGFDCNKIGSIKSKSSNNSMIWIKP